MTIAKPQFDVLKALSAPFASEDVHWKAQAVKADRALAVAYIDARAVMDRLDEVCGLNWSDAYDVLPSGSVVCRLQVTLDGQAIVKTDVGSPSEQPDEGDKMKAAFSDALKRAAIKFGIGRYLYRLPKQWVDYDAQRKTLKSQPQLPAWAMPGKRQPAAPAPVTTEQAKELQRLLQANRRIDPAKFLAIFHVSRLSQIAAPRYADAVALLTKPPTGILRAAA
jgi:hypothetical protein